MQPELFTLPHSGLRVPHTGYTVTSLKQHETRDGVSYTATLRLHGKIIGTIENEGHGGPDTFYPSAPDGYREHTPALEAFAEHCRQGVYATGNLATVPMLEFVLADLVTEYEIGRDATKAAKQGKALLRMQEDYADDNDKPMGMPSSTTYFAIAAAEATDRARLARRIAKTADMAPHPLAWWQLWDAAANQWADITARPAHLTEETK